MIVSRWKDSDAKRYVQQYGPKYGKDLALRVYTSRLIGEDSTLVLHGGGNTSVKSMHTDVFGKKVPGLYVKGSGWDLKTIEPEGMVGLDLEFLRTLSSLESLTDEMMVNLFRTHLFDASSANPSIETLLHAFMEPKFVDHSHADAILALTNTRDSKKILRDCFGDELIMVPYVMPGFDLAKLARKMFLDQPGKRGMVLEKHGLFTWGETARESYERHIEIVRQAERFAATRGKKGRSKGQAVRAQAKRPPISVEEFLPILRGEMALRGADGGIQKRFVFTFRNSARIQEFFNSPNFQRLSQSGPLTPDHIIRTKQFPMSLNLGSDFSEESLRARVRSALQSYESNYVAYFHRCKNRVKESLQMLDARPRGIFVPGLGLFAAGDSAKDAEAIADIFEHTVDAKLKSDAISKYQALSEGDLFAIEYWSLEQAKLKKKGGIAPLQGRVALVTGGLGAIGFAVAKALRQGGAEVVIADRDAKNLAKADLGILQLRMDVASPSSVRSGFSEICRRFGGLDIVIPNAGIAFSSPIEKIQDDVARSVMGVNFHGYLLTVQEAARVMKSQKTGGDIVIISSKNVFAPGAEFGIYSASKAAGHQLGRVAAMELAPHRIRVNMINPDAVFGTNSRPSGLWKEVGPNRAKAHGIRSTDLPEFYRKRNLLQTTVSAEDVAHAVLFFVSKELPITGASLPVDGGIPAAFPR